MKNLRKTASIAMALMIIIVVSGCGSIPGTNYTTTGNASLGTGNAYVPGTSALTGTITGTGMNVGFNYGTTNRNRLGTNVTPYPGTGTSFYTGTGALPRTGTAGNYGTGMGTRPGTGTAYSGTYGAPGSGFYGTGTAYPGTYRTGAPLPGTSGTGTAAHPGTGYYGTGTAAHPGTGYYGTGTAAHPGTGYTGMGTTAHPGTYGMGTTPGTTGTTVGKVGSMRLKDGMYNASCDRRPNGSDDATLTIRNGRIEKVSLRRFDGSGKEVNYNTTAGAAGRTANTNLKRTKDEIVRQVVSKQNINVTPTTTGTSADASSWVTAIRRAMDKARV